MAPIQIPLQSSPSKSIKPASILVIRGGFVLSVLSRLGGDHEVELKTAGKMPALPT